MPAFAATVVFEFESEGIEKAGSELRRLQLAVRDAGFTMSSGQVLLASAEATMPLPDHQGITQFSGVAGESLREARRLAEARGHQLVGTEHLLLALTRQSDEAFARRLLDEIGATDVLRSRIEAVLGES